MAKNDYLLASLAVERYRNCRSQLHEDCFSSSATVHFRDTMDDLMRDNTPIEIDKKISNMLRLFHKYKRFVYPEQIQWFHDECLAKLCFINNVDSETVVSVLKCVYNYWGEVSHFILHMAVEPLFLLKTDETTCKQKMSSSLSFFLEHCRLKRLTFGGRRITDAVWDEKRSPGLCSAFYASAQSLLTLFQYGSKVDIMAISMAETSELLAEHSGVFAALVWIASKSVEVDPLESRSLLQLASSDEAIQKMIAMYRLMLRESPLPYITMSELRNIPTSPPETRRLILPEPHTLCKVYRVLFPDLVSTPYQPRSLKHLCKCSVRKRLNYNWMLPDGIWTLKLPRALQNYLNLMED